MKAGDRARDRVSNFTGTIIGLDQSGNPPVIHRALLQAPAPGGVGKVGDRRAELWVPIGALELLDGAADVTTAPAAQRSRSAPLLSAEERAALDQENHDAIEARIAEEQRHGGANATPASTAAAAKVA